MMLMLVALSQVGHHLINAERARIISQVGVLATVYGGESTAREIVQLNDATLCGYRKPTTQQEHFALCVDVHGVQRFAHAVDTWTISVPTLEP
jgi:hypothetical protein